MLVLRPVREKDLDAVMSLSRQTTHGLTTLPTDEEILGRRIRNSIDSFQRLDSDPVQGDEYFLVLENLDSGALVGTSAIDSKVGGFEPFYAYRIETEVHESKTLGVHKEIRTLHLVTEHAGPSEIGTLFLLPGVRRGGVGRLLSLGRFLLIAEHPEAFDATVIAEMRGIIDERGQSPFWEALGRHFFDVDLPTADYMSIADKSFIADLMPTYPIYIPMLPEKAQAVIGRVHPLTSPALHLLEEEGFRHAGLVDIFEAGPIIECPRDEIRTIRESRVAQIVSTEEPAATDFDRPEFIVANRVAFRAATGMLSESAQGISMTPTLANALDLRAGDPVRYAPLRSQPRDRKRDRSVEP